MRILFFLLLFINFAFAIYIQIKPDEDAAAGAVSELHPEKIKLLPTSPRPVTCLELGTFVDADLKKVRAAISFHNLDGDLIQQETGMAPFYWVYFPPLSNRQHVERKMGEIKRLGITDYSPVQENGKWNNAISLGFFEKIEDARSFLASLRSKGVRTAVIGARNLAQVKFVAKTSSENVRAKMEELRQEFPASMLKTAECAPGSSEKPEVANNSSADS